MPVEEWPQEHRVADVAIRHERERPEELLAELANNEKLFLDLIAGGETFEGVLPLLSPPQTLFLGHRGGFALRLNIWLPVKESLPFRSEELSVSAYGFAHNHDFRFMTGAGHFVINFL